MAPLTHPLLAAFSNTKRQLAVLEANLGSPAAAHLWDHVVSERAIMPGAGSFDLACSAARLLLPPSTSTANVAVNDITLPAPLLLPQRRSEATSLSVQVRLELLTGLITVASTEVQQTHLVGHVQWAAQDQTDVSSAAVTKCSRAMAWLQTRQQTDSVELGSASYGLIAASTSVAAQLDCAFHLGALMPLPGAGQAGFSPALLRVPVGAQAIMLGTSPYATGGQLVAVSQVQSASADGSLTTDFSIPMLGHVQQLLAKPMSSNKAQNLSEASEAGSMLYVMSRPACEPWVLDEAALTAPNSQLKLVGTSAFATYAKALAAAKDAASGALAEANGHSSVVVRTAGALSGACTAQPLATAADSSHLLGLRALIKTLGHENPLLPCHATDLHAAHTSLVSSSKAAMSIVPSNSSTAQQAQHGSAQQAGILHTSKLLPMAAANSPALEGHFQLMPVPRGSLDCLKKIRLPKLAPAAGQVLLEVHAVGVNFRDVLNVLGMYPGDPGAPGADCAGVVTAVGTGVTGLSAGM